MQKDCLCAGIEDLLDVILGDNGLAVDQHLITVDRNNLAGIFVDEILHPGLEKTGSELAADTFLKIGLVDLYFLSQTEYFNDVLIALKTDSAQQGCHGQFLLAVDIGIHHIVDVRCKFNPRAAERNDTCRI